MKKVLVVGSWAKEQITIENLKRRPETKAFCYLDTQNPGITSLVDGYRKGSLYDVSDIADYADEIAADTVLITNATSLSAGVVDLLTEKGIRAFGPDRSAARLESDKIFCRSLLSKYEIPGLPEFEVFDEVESAIDYAKRLDWEVAVKPAGLTEGLGVKVFGDQLMDAEEVRACIRHILSESGEAEGTPRLLVEEKLEGEEFTLQCFVNGGLILPTPVVQDFKKLLPDDKGPNTASMGSYSLRGNLLPFMENRHYEAALEIMRKTLSAFERETGDSCRGFLYGQFMITKAGLKLIEYNFRPGDPEWMNTVAVMRDNILDVVEDVMDGKERKIHFDQKATVCRYIVPKEYPYELNKVLEVDFDETELRQKGVALYYSCGVDDEGTMNVGSERGLALLARGDTVRQAADKLDSVMPLIKGDYYYRSDIGTKEMMESKSRNRTE